MPVKNRAAKLPFLIWDVNSKGWLAESGQFEVLLGTSSDNIVQQASFEYMAMAK